MGAYKLVVTFNHIQCQRIRSRHVALTNSTRTLDFFMTFDVQRLLW